MAEKTALLAPRSRRESPSPAAFPLPFSTVVVSTWGSWMWEMRSHKRRHPHQGGMGAQVTPHVPSKRGALAVGAPQELFANTLPSRNCVGSAWRLTLNNKQKTGKTGIRSQTIHKGL